MARRLYKNLTVQVLTAISLGILLGYVMPEWGKAMEPLAKGFINLVKMIVAPVVFLTIVTGIAKMRDLKQAGRVGLRAIGYFLAVTTLALGIGMAVANVVRPGVGVEKREPTASEKEVIKKYVDAAKKKTGPDLLLSAIPNTFISAFTEGEMLQVLLVAILTGVAVAGLGERAAPILTGLEYLTEVMFRIVGMVMKVAPLGAFGAMAFTIGEFGIGSLQSLA